MRSLCTRCLLFVFATTLTWTLIGCSGDRGEMSMKSAPDEKSVGASPQKSESYSAEESMSGDLPAEGVAAESIDGGDWGSAPEMENEFPMTAAPEFEPVEPIAKSAAPNIHPTARPKIANSKPSGVNRSFGTKKKFFSAPPSLNGPEPVKDNSSSVRKMGAAPVEAAAMEPVPVEAAPMEAARVEAPPVEAPPIAANAPKRDESGFTEVKVFYGTDRNRESITATSPETLKTGVIATIALLVCAIALLVFNRLKMSLAMGGLAGILFVGLYWWQQDAPMRDGISYGIDRGKLVRGISTVTVPKSHQRGQVERPSIFRFEFEEDKNKHVVLAKATELSSELFYQQMSQAVQRSGEGDLLLFVHGFNVAFDEAIRRTAQIAVDLSFQGVPVCYSWPSQGSLLGYTIDENNVIWTVPHLRDFLLELAESSGARSINIIAHSMGNRAVTSSLSQLSLQLSADQLPLVDQVILAAPDVDADHFRNELAPRLAAVAGQVTLYASSDDQALVASKHLHGGYPRAGESGENLVVVPHIETIDVSGIDLSLLGHNYYGSSESILRDLFEVVRRRLPAHQRTGLITQRLRDTTYWLLAQPRLSEKEDDPIR